MWLLTIVLLAEVAGGAPAAANNSPAQIAYRKLTAAELSAKKIEQPPKDAQRIDVSEKIRSASFGHKTWLLVTPDGKQFWVEYGASTNSKAQLFGPFAVVSGAKAGMQQTMPPSGVSTTTSGGKDSPPPPVVPSQR